MPRRSPLQSTPREDPRELRELTVRSRVRFGLSTKFMVPVAVATALVIGGMGFFVHRTSTEALEEQFNRQGILAARLAAAPDPSAWDEDQGTYASLSRELTRRAIELPGTPSEKASAGDDRRRSQNRTRLLNLSQGASGGVQGTLDIWILDSGGQHLARASTGAMRIRRPESAYALSLSPKTAIRRGSYGAEGNDEPVRYFEHPILGASDQKIGTAVVVQSESRLRQDIAALDRTIILFCLVGIIGCSLVAFISSKVVTRPLDQLLRDIRAVAGGRLDHRTRVRSDDEIGALAMTFDQMTRNLFAAQNLKADLLQKEHEVELASEVQSRLVPRELPTLGSISLFAAQVQVGTLSADLYDAIVLPNGHLGLFLMSASGEGLPATIVLSMARASIRSLGAESDRPGPVLQRMNRVIATDLRRGMFVSALYITLDPKTGEGHLASAGHRVPTLHYVAEARGLRRLQADGIAIGLDSGPVFDQSLTETSFRLEPGDRLFLVSEGLFGQSNAEGKTPDEAQVLRALLGLLKEKADTTSLISGLGTKLHLSAKDRDVTLFEARRAEG